MVTHTVDRINLFNRGKGIFPFPTNSVIDEHLDFKSLHYLGEDLVDSGNHLPILALSDKNT
jgi:hypothetical protein